MSYEGNNLGYWKVHKYIHIGRVCLSPEEPPNIICHTVVKAQPEKNEITAESKNICRAN